jgi:LPPG:FO 2-phospho-L-lactate transferase
VSAPATATGGHWLLLSGGVGGAKLALGLDRALPAGALGVIANTGDDFRHLGLAISPDLDTLMYTLAGVVNEETGWGLAGETWEFMGALGRLGGETWFRVGDRDLATHVERTRRLAAGETLAEVTGALCARLGIHTRVWPMSDTPVETRVATAAGELCFQHYFVRERATPAVTGFRYVGAEAGAPPPAALAALCDPELRGILIAPSNPWLSIAPILAIPPLGAALRAAPAG